MEYEIHVPISVPVLEINSGIGSFGFGSSHRTVCFITDTRKRFAPTCRPVRLLCIFEVDRFFVVNLLHLVPITFWADMLSRPRRVRNTSTSVLRLVWSRTRSMRTDPKDSGPRNPYGRISHRRLGWARCALRFGAFGINRRDSTVRASNANLIVIRRVIKIRASVSTPEPGPCWFRSATSLVLSSSWNYGALVVESLRLIPDHLSRSNCDFCVLLPTRLIYIYMCVRFLSCKLR